MKTFFSTYLKKTFFIKQNVTSVSQDSPAFSPLSDDDEDFLNTARVVDLPPPTVRELGVKRGEKRKGKTKPEIPHFEMPSTEGFPDFIPAAKR